MPKKYLVVCAVLITALIAGFGLTPIAYTHDDHDDHPPSARQIEFARATSELLLNELLAALGKEFSETTPQNVAHGKLAISLVFNDLNRDMRLVGSFRPLQGGNNNRPSDSFEAGALALALNGGQAKTDVQEVNGTWYYRRSFPLSNTFHPSCVLCHSNFTPQFFASTNNPGQWVGSLMLRVPIKSNED